MGDVSLSAVASTNIVTEQIAAQRENDGEDENPQQGEESETEDKERQFTHAETPGRIRKIRWVPPIVMTSPCSSGADVMRFPFNTVPFVE